MKCRIESDTMGEVKIPDQMSYGASTQRAVDNFPVSGSPMPSSFIQALGLVKWSAAVANQELGLLDKKLAKTIATKALEVFEGKHNKHFPIDVFQTGSGTSSNMNANEVIANLANLELSGKLGTKSPVHPNDHVNMGQSSNDVIPTTIHVATILSLNENLFPSLKALAKSLQKKSKQWEKVIKIGRTHLQDATPITFGQEFSGYASQVEKSLEKIRQAASFVEELAIGGTAVGTGINTHPQFGGLVVKHLSKKTSFCFREANNHFEAQGGKEAIVFLSGSLKALAVALMKIANDIRWLGSGPRCGLGEINLPSLQPGSSIMPGKVNPVICEMVMQVAAQVIGNDTAITVGGQAGNFELNVMMPMMGANLLGSIKILGRAARLFDQKCIQGLEVNKERAEELVEQSLAMVTSLVPVIGYDKSAALAKKAYSTGKTIRSLLKEEKILSEADIKKYLDPNKMIKPTE